jgi:hypothetical protein
MKPDSHEEIPVTLDEATKAKLDEAVEVTGLAVGMFSASPLKPGCERWRRHGIAERLDNGGSGAYSAP